MPKQLQKNTRNIDKAIQQGFAALDLNPELRMVQKYTAAYLVHKFDLMLCFCQKMKMDDTEVLYSILFIEDCFSVDAGTIKKHYKEVALLVHPDKNDLIAAEEAFKIIRKAWETLLFDHNKRRIT
ncbi:Uncharacterized protein TCM_021286 [Theobroma cacao]|uniref:J domain-containing protein n=1 Tax=Theobroma cacao TaxID=3641 RepID=A0A061ENK6_THECC|nr:Uncharacterized protein TCM_021286 [Theobroma cacao]